MANKNTIPVSMQTLTPIHIGSGNELRGNFEYLYFREEGRIAVIDPMKILGIIGEENIDKWVSVIDNEQNLLKDLPMLRHVEINDIAQRIIDILKNAPNPEKNAIKEQIFLGDAKATVPGSSLKGSIRTAILTKLIQDNPSFVQQEKNLGSQKRNFIKYHDKQISANYLGKEDRPNRYGELQPSPNKDLLRFLRVSDFYFDDSTSVVKSNIINQFRHGWGEKREQSSFWECIPQNANAIGNIQIPKELIQRVQEKRYLDNRNFYLLDIKRLFKLINTHTLNLLDREIGFWESEDNPLAIGDYLDKLEAIETIAKNADETTCVLRVGAGSGWEYMTGGWAVGKDAFGDYILDDEVWGRLKREFRRGKRYPDDTVFPKTRKLIDGGEPLGFVKLKIQ